MSLTTPLGNALHSLKQILSEHQQITSNIDTVKSQLILDNENDLDCDRFPKIPRSPTSLRSRGSE
jgi:hypothetical protein